MASPPVAYLVNQYPKVSHSFIRREILALERQGIRVERFALRGWDDLSADVQDQAEKTQTRYLLKQGAVALLPHAFKQFLTSPVRFIKAIGVALSMGRRSDKLMVFHLAYLLEACQLVNWCKRLGVGHVHAHFGTNSTAVAMLSKLLGGPRYSFTVHGPEEFDKPEALSLGTKIQHSAFVVAISSFGRSQLFRWVPHSQWHKVQVVHCGLEKAFHEGADGAPTTQPRLVCVGRLCEQKGQLLLVQAAKLVADQGHDFHVVLAGDGEMRPEIESEIKRLGLQARFSITGWITSDQVREQLLSARALVLPSFAEGLPVVLMEAMALKRPVITTYVAGIPELVSQGTAGWLCAAGDVNALAHVLVDCLQASPEQLAAMGQAAHAQATSRHDVDTESRKLSALFEFGAAKEHACLAN